MLVKYEFHKYFTRFHIILLTVMLVFNIGLTAYQYSYLFTDEQNEINEAKNYLIDLFLDDEEAYNQIYEEHSARLGEYEGKYYTDFFYNETKTINVFESQFIDLYDYNDINLFRDVEETIHAPDEYKRKIASLIRDSVLRLEESESDEYIYKYYVSLCSYYMPLADKNLDIAETRGWNEYFSLQIPTVLLAIALISTLCGTFTNDRRAGMNNILHISRNGGKSVVISKLLFIGLISCTVTLLFTLSPLIVFASSSGLSSLGQPVQALRDFQYCPYDITVGQYLLLYLLLRVVVFTVFSLLTAVMSCFFENEKFAFIIVAVLAVSGVFLSRISPSSEYYFLQKFSISELAGINILFTRYRGLNIMGQCINYTFFMIGAVIASALLLVSVSVMYKQNYSLEFAERDLTSAHSRNTMSLFTTELYKQLICGKYIYVVFAAIILKLIISGIYYQPSENYSESLYRDYITQVSGEITEEKLQAIEAEAAYIEASIAGYETAGSDYRNGKISYEDYQKYISRYNYASYYKNACDKLCIRRDYLLTVSDTYSDVEFIYDEGMDRYFNTSFDVITVITILFLGSNIFACEYESGYSKIMRTLKKGRKNIFKSKFIYAAVSAICLYLIFSFINIGFISYYYDIDFWNAPVQSMPRFAEIGPDMSIAEYLVLHELISLLGYIACFLLTSSLSVVTESQLKAIITVIFFVLIPYLIGYMGIADINIFNYIDMISPQNVTTGMASYISCAVITTLSMIIARRKWCGREV